MRKSVLNLGASLGCTSLNTVESEAVMSFGDRPTVFQTSSLTNSMLPLPMDKKIYLNNKTSCITAFSNDQPRLNNYFLRIFTWPLGAVNSYGLHYLPQIGKHGSANWQSAYFRLFSDIRKKLKADKKNLKQFFPKKLKSWPAENLFFSICTVLIIHNYVLEKLPRTIFYFLLHVP